MITKDIQKYSKKCYFSDISFPQKVIVFPHNLHN